MAFHHTSYFQFLVFLLLLSGTAFSTIVKNLPGFSGDLPFTLETGYTSVGDVEFFYYFVESENNPAGDPLLLYLNGGPGCSALNGFLFQVGPLKFDRSNYTSGLPTLLYESNSWAKHTNILFLDAPVGAGFSYATTLEAWNTTDTQNAQQVTTFMRNWLSNHTSFLANPVYIGTDSYAGINSPMIALDILNGNEAGDEPIINLKGLSLGCPHTDTDLETDAKIPFAHRMALIPDELFEKANKSCNGSYAVIASNNTECIEAVDAIDECIELINRQNILEPYCALLSPELAEDEKVRRYLREHTANFIMQSPQPRDLYCHNLPYLLSVIWGNYESVQEALGVRQGTVEEFYRCNITLSYTVDVNSVIPQHKELTKKGLQLLVFSGDHDMVMPHNGVEEWISFLDLTLDSDWRPWFVEGQVAGYTRTFDNEGYRLTYATIKGAGHSPPEDKRKECYIMFHRWINYYPL
ncbi:serine carboxypeptidase-like 7 [Mangifera indica]|uniref:serine carboxypeptidase-like 7 n=1 Tax=Mangifera indica TaxID=29780 RepID=UPI001CFA8960|nr:serine carboxypeptidase-like 7 [Mangifera indica]